MTDNSLMPEGKPDRLDKYRLHLLNGRGLSPNQRKQLARYRKANGLLCEGYSRQQVIKFFTKADPKTGQEPISETQAYQVVSDALKLFGDVAEADRKGMRHVMYEVFMKAHRKAARLLDHQASIRALENAAKIEKLFEKDADNFDLAAFMELGNISFSSDPKVLKLQQTGSAENENTDEFTDYEEE